MITSQNFEQLPPEVLLVILASLSNLHTLYNLLTASPGALHVFDEYAATVSESVLSGPQSLLPEDIQEVIRAVALVRAGTVPFRSLDDFENRFIRCGKLPGLRSKDVTPITLGRGSISSSTPPAILRGVVATARQLSILTHACLDFYLAHIREASSAPVRRPGGDPGLPAEPVAIRDAGPPSWVEEMRVARALWIIELTRSLQRAGAQGALTALQWSDDDVGRLMRTEPEGLVHPSNPAYGGREEMLTVREYLQELGGDEQMPWPKPDAVAQGWVTQRPVEIERVWGDMEYRYGEKLDRRPPPEVRAKHKFPTITDGVRWGQARSNYYSPPPAVQFLVHLRMHDVLVYLGDDTGFNDITSPGFRRLGVALWDQKRLHFLGLMDGAQPPHHISTFFRNAWRNLLKESTGPLEGFEAAERWQDGTEES